MREGLGEDQEGEVFAGARKGLGKRNSGDIVRRYALNNISLRMLIVFLFLPLISSFGTKPFFS